MKRYIGKYLMLLGGLLALAPMSGCKLDDPEIPVEELYLRNFIKQYGLIDPTQDFSSAVQSSVTLNIPGKASVVNVYAQTGEDFYRVGCFADLEGTVKLPVDISEATTSILVDVDGVRYYAEPGGTIDVKSGSSVVRSRAGSYNSVPASYDVKSLWIDPTEWTEVTKKNGETEESYSSRQVIFIGSDGEISSTENSEDRDNSNSSIYKVPGNSVVDGCFNVAVSAHIGANLLGYKNSKTTLGDNKSAEANKKNPGEVGHTINGSNVQFLIKNNDDALAAYRFVFRTAAKNNAKVRVVLLGQHTTGGDDNGVYVFMDSGNLEIEGDDKGSTNTADEDKYTEWELRTELLPRGYYELIIIGVDSEPNFDGEQTCGNWGFMTMKRIKTAKDMRWILACEDLGTTDDFDFNDVVFSIEAVNTNTAAMKLGVVQWQVVENPDDGTVLHPAKAPASRVEGNSEYKTRVRVEALAAGGTLPIWLHFREEEGDGKGTDYIVCPNYNDGYRGCLKEVSQIAATEVTNEESGANYLTCSEWHRWFDNEKSSKNMLNTGTTTHSSITRSVTFYTKNVFSMENFCYLKFVTDQVVDGLPYYFDEDVNLDPWAKKVLQWDWQQKHSQDVTFGFFLTVYHPVVGSSSSSINSQIEASKKGEGHIIGKSLEGLPPQMFLIPDCDPLKDSGYIGEEYGWKWPCERVDITEVYPNFKSWVADAKGYYGINWFMLPQPGIVDNDRKLYPRNPEDQKKYVPFSLSSTTTDNTTEN